MSRLYKQNEGTAARREFPVFLVDATDGITPEIGEAGGQPQISKAGATTFTNTTATLVAIGNGGYIVVLTVAEFDTLGRFLVRYKSAATAEFQLDGEVVAFDPHDAVRAGLTALPNAAASAAGGLGTLTDLGLVRTNTAQGGAAQSITLDAAASAVTDFFKGDAIWVVSGTGAGQLRICTAYNGTSKVATVDRVWATNPDATSVFLAFGGSLAMTVAEVNTEALDVLATDTYSELAALPAVSGATLAQMVQWLYHLARNKATQTSTTTLLKKDDGTTTLATQTVSDDGSTYSAGEWV